MKVKYMVILAIVGFVIILAIDICIFMATGFIFHAGYFEMVWVIGCIIYIAEYIDRSNQRKTMKEAIKLGEKENEKDN